MRALTLDGEGMPVLLSRMRQQLFGMNGHLVEGIFRVSPGAAELKQARRHLDAGQLAKVASAECLAQLIKLWFRERLRQLSPDIYTCTRHIHVPE